VHRRRAARPKTAAHAPVSCRFTERSETNERGIRSAEALRTRYVDQVDGKRLWDSLMTMAKIGARPKAAFAAWR
jgi:hypothetical protein